MSQHDLYPALGLLLKFSAALLDFRALVLDIVVELCAHLLTVVSQVPLGADYTSEVRVLLLEDGVARRRVSATSPGSSPFSSVRGRPGAKIFC